MVRELQTFSLIRSEMVDDGHASLNVYENYANLLMDRTFVTRTNFQIF